ncbi:hypothetical protein LUZ63_001209 [Rhynchospora breviuscula]|uniref:Uncharacterized protein n=1 Tax=Rhynchospora breviuscula TaxID=2022672 RepID=A0A9Q0HXC6_9POAL|nr:hypothetical protein LUZ63_001209 [Rhynchospora breviuscula]
MKSLTLLVLTHIFLLAFASSAQGYAYDFFYFVQQRPFDFGIHGLWPNYNNGSYPANCDPNNPFAISQIQDLVSSLRANWTSLSCPSSDSSSFWQHEWDKHGTCSETVLNQHGYFQAALNLKSKTGLLSCLKSAGISPNGGSYTSTNVEAAIKTCIGHTPYVECNKDASSRYQLYQVYTCHLSLFVVELSLDPCSQWHSVHVCYRARLSHRSLLSLSPQPRTPTEHAPPLSFSVTSSSPKRHHFSVKFLGYPIPFNFPN